MIKEIKRLTNLEMENIAGGLAKYQVCRAATVASGAVAVVSLVSAVGCKVGNLVWRVKANNAFKRGDEGTFCKFNGRAQACSIAAASCVAGAVAGFVGFAVGDTSRYKWGYR